MTALELYHSTVEAWNDGILSDYELVMQVIFIGGLTEDCMNTRPDANGVIQEYLATTYLDA
jgi:hypothetical protein